MNAPGPVVMPDFLYRRPTPRIEAAVASLEALGVAPERVCLIPVGRLESYKGEVVGQVPEAGTPLSEHGEIVLFVARVGLADRLPDYLLEPLPTVQDEVSVSIEPGQTLDFWERQVRAYGSGRAFLTVIDQALHRLHRELGRVSSSLTSITDDPTFATRLLGFVLLDDLPVEPVEQLLLAAEFQRFHEWVGPENGIRTVLEQIFDVPVEVVKRTGPELQLRDTDFRPLGTPACRLGRDVHLGLCFVDTQPILQIRLGPLPLALFNDFDRRPRFRAKIEALLGILCPAACEQEYKLVLQEEDRTTVLGDSSRARLGRTSYLNDVH